MRTLSLTKCLLSNIPWDRKLNENSGFWQVPLGNESALLGSLIILWQVLFQEIALWHFIRAGTPPNKDVGDPGGNYYAK